MDVDPETLTPPRSESQSPLLKRTVTWTTRSREGHARWYYVAPVQLLQTLSVVITVPLLPRVKLQFFNGDSNITTRVQGIAEVVRAIGTTLVSAELGSLSDMIGRRPVILLGLVSNMAPLLCLLLSANLWIYFSVFALAGVLGGQANLFNAYIADCSQEGDRSLRFGVVAAASAAGFALGPLVGSTLERRAGTEPVFAVAAAVALLAIGALLSVPESLPADKRRQPKLRVSAEAFVQPVREFACKAGARMWLLVAVQVLRGCVLEGYMTVSLFALTELVPRWTDQDNGVLLSVVGGGQIIAQGFLLPCLTRLGSSDSFLALFSQSVTTLGTALTAAQLASVRPKTHIFAVIGLTNCCQWFDPVFTKLITTGLEDDLGLVLGMFQSINSFTAVVAPMLFTGAFAVSPLSVFVLIACLNALSLLLVAVVVCAHTKRGCRR